MENKTLSQLQSRIRVNNFNRFIFALCIGWTLHHIFIWAIVNLGYIKIVILR